MRLRRLRDAGRGQARHRSFPEGGWGMSALIFPTVHRNGTHGPDLLELQLDARSAILDAIKALQTAGPNGRDYYPQGPDAIQLAIAQHSDRLALLNRVYNELSQIAEAIVKQEAQ